MSKKNSLLRLPMSAFRVSLLRLGVAAAIATTAAPAYALCDGCVVAAVTTASATITSAVASAAASVNTAIAAAATAITGAAATNNQQLITQLGMQSSLTQQMLSETAKNTQDTILRSALGQNMVQNDRSFRVTNPCMVGATSVGVGGAMAAATLPTAGNPESLGRNNPSPTVRFGGGVLSGQMKRALTISGTGKDEGGNPVPPPEVTAVVAAAGGCGSFVSGGARADRCRAARLSTGNLSGYENADIRASTLVEGPRRAGAPMSRSVDMDAGSAEQVAFEAYRRNISSPLELRDLQPGEAATDAGRRYLALKDSYDARIALGQYPTEMQAAHLKSRPDFIPYLRELLKPEGDADFVNAYLAARKPNWGSKGISAAEFFNLENERRYMNINWLSKTLSWSDRERAAEHLRVAALTNVLLLKNHEESRMTNLLLGALLMSKARQESLPEMKAAHLAAQK